MWLVHLEDFADHMIQGEPREELQENIKDIHKEVTSGRIPGARRVAELQVA